MEEIKSFFDVFPQFTCQKDIMDLLEHVNVKEAVLVKSEKTLKIYITSRILISKQDIYFIEDALATYIFQGSMRVKMMEQYELSNQYNIQTLTDAYKESMLFELSVESAVLHRFVKTAEWYIDGDIITLTLVDNFLARTRSVDIKSYLESVYKERFGFEIKVGFSYTEEQKNTIRRANEHKLQQEISEIMSRQVDEDDTLANEQKADSTKDSEKSEKKGNAGNNGSNNNGDSKPKTKENSWNRTSFSRNKIHDPEVIYGNNVEGKEVIIADLSEATGECVIRGQVFDIEEKELKNGEKLIILFSITDFTDSIIGKIFVTKQVSNRFKISEKREWTLP